MKGCQPTRPTTDRAPWFFPDSTFSQDQRAQVTAFTGPRVGPNGPDTRLTPSGARTGHPPRTGWRGAFWPPRSRPRVQGLGTQVSTSACVPRVDGPLSTRSERTLSPSSPPVRWPRVRTWSRTPQWDSGPDTVSRRRFRCSFSVAPGWDPAPSQRVHPGVDPGVIHRLTSQRRVPGTLWPAEGPRSRPWRHSQTHITTTCRRDPASSHSQTHTPTSCRRDPTPSRRTQESTMVSHTDSRLRVVSGGPSLGRGSSLTTVAGNVRSQKGRPTQTLRTTIPHTR